MRLSHVLACTAWIPYTACADMPDTGTVDEDLTSTNGRSLNGTSLNGRSLNGRSLDGKTLDGVSFMGVSGLAGSRLLGVGVGSILNGVVSDGSNLSLRVDSVSTLAAPNDDVWVYGVSYTADGTTWQSVCTRGAVAFAGTWNYASGVVGGGSWSPSSTTFTFGCRGTALAKCAELGYKPWNGDSLAQHHEACTRMLRADYCGDGTSYTFDGWQLDVFDDLGIQTPTPNLPDWQFEAHWGPRGAACMTSYRALDLIVSSDLPSCVAARLSDTCTDDDFADGSLLQDYFNPWSINVALQNAYASYPLSKKDLSAAMSLVDLALQNLAKKPPKTRDAAQDIEQAITHIKSALTKDLPAAFGDDLMRRYTLLVRSSLTDKIAKAPATITVAQLACAKQNLAAGDTLLAKPDYPNATNRYKNGLGCFN